MGHNRLDTLAALRFAIALHYISFIYLFIYFFFFFNITFITPFADIKC